MHKSMPMKPWCAGRKIPVSSARMRCCREPCPALRFFSSFSSMRDRVRVSTAGIAVELVLCFLRRHFGEANLSKTTLLDWRFLV